MAFTSPKTWTSAVLSSSDMNTYIRDNQNALRSGAIAIASQAAEDFIVASSTTQLARQDQASIVLMMEVFG